MCFHDWYILSSMPEAKIKALAENRQYTTGRSEAKHEKICLKCEKYVNEIYDAFEFFKTEKIALDLREKQRKEKVDKILKHLNLSKRTIIMKED